MSLIIRSIIGLLRGVLQTNQQIIPPKDEIELVVTADDVSKMLNEDVVGVYQTPYGPIFTAMSKDTME